jgi:phosphohistidine phosphatase SixA
LAVEQGSFGPAQLIDALQQGGLVLYFRHAATDHTQDDRHPIDLSDCSTQRNLSPAGRQQARDIGEAIGRLNIPVGEVRTSPFCRCHETAQLLFGRFTVDDNLYFSVAVDKTTRSRHSEHLRRLLSTPPRAGKNRVIVSHTGNLREATGIWPKPEGAAWVFRPLGEGGYEALGMMDPGHWSNTR